MPRLKLTLQYDGAAYVGWQVQANGPSVQAALQDAFETIRLGRAPVTGASRTDAGVHATGQVCHVDVPADTPDPRRLILSLNSVLPHDIRVTGIAPVGDGFHARYAATAKSYRYLIATSPAPPRLRGSVWEYFPPLDTDVMAAAAPCLVGEHDFRAFQAAASDMEDTVRIIYSAGFTDAHFPGLTPTDAPLLAFDICGNGFLHKMVRAIVGTLVDIGAGRIDPDALPRMLEPRGKRLSGVGEPVAPDARKAVVPQGQSRVPGRADTRIGMSGSATGGKRLSEGQSGMSGSATGGKRLSEGQSGISGSATIRIGQTAPACGLTLCRVHYESPPRPQV